ncbi:MAG: transporter [Nitrospirota bacterium]
MMKTIVMAVFVALTLGMADPVSAAHPLITDDTGTQGKGKFQIEMNGEYGADKETVEGVTVKETESEASATFSWGVTEDTDIVLGLPRRDFTIKENGAAIASESGLSDLSLEYKHRFFEKDGLSMAVKPGITLPTGGEERGLGTGKPSYGILFITTKEAGPWAIHANIGYTHNEYKLQADEDANKKGIWHASLATEVEVVKDLKAVANIGTERNADKASDSNPAFLLGGFIYSLRENLDFDAGVKTGLSDAETDLTVLAGVAMRF